MNDAQVPEKSHDPDQKAAISACCDGSRRIVAVTGQAGTGKTTILSDVHKYWIGKGKRVVLCAPTGKAAKRIKEATDIPAMTMHRLLEYPFPGERDEETGKALVSGDPKRDRRHPIEFDVVLADEYAMVNVEVHRNILDALPSGGIIRMFGDANQLSPIETSKKLREEPSPFLKILDKFEGCWLNTIHRQDEGSDIIENGNRIIRGGIPKRSETYQLMINDRPVDVFTDFVMDTLVDGPDFSIIENQMIAPVKQGWVGTEPLNTLYQTMVHSAEKPYLELERQKWDKRPSLKVYMDDKIIFTVNNYSLEIFNGETGVVIGVQDDASIDVDFGDRIANIPCILEMDGKDGTFYVNPQKDVELAYVITTHKSQGSEYNIVVYIMNSSRSFLLNRKNFYTATMRARKKVIVMCDQKALGISLAKKGDK